MICPQIQFAIDQALLFSETNYKINRVKKMSKSVTSKYRDWNLDKAPKFFIQIKGTTRIEYPGGEFILEESDVLLMGPTIIHRETDLSPDKDNIRLIIALIDGHYQVVVTGKAEKEGDEMSTYWDYLNSSYRPLALEMMNVLVKPEFSIDETTERHFIKSFLHLLKEAYPKTETSKAQYPSLVEMALSIIRAQVSNSSLNVQALAKQLDCSSEHLSRVFSNACGITLKNYLIKQRLNLAESLLKSQPTLNISEVAYMTGFASADYFSICFKKAYKMTASQFKKNAVRRQQRSGSDK